MNTTRREVNVFALRNDTVAFAGPGISNGRIFIDTELGQIVFRLQATSVSFPSSPIQWTVQEPATTPGAGTVFRPIPQPAEATVLRNSDRETVIEITNQPQETREHSFFVIVQTADGKFFGTDPTIVTMRPDPPPSGS
jgi:hypothetical protein